MSGEVVLKNVRAQKDLDGFLDYYRLEKGATDWTLRGYKSNVMGFLAFAKSKYPQQVNYRLIHKFLDTLYARGLTNTSVCKILTALKMFYKYLHKRRGFKKNPFEDIERPKKEVRVRKHFSFDDIDKIMSLPDISTPKGRRDRAMLELFYSGGLRRAEVVNLKVRDVNIQRRTVRVYGKGRKERIVPFRQECANMVAIYMRENNARDHESLFGLSGYQIYRVVKKYIENVDPEAYPHRFRHSFGTHLVIRGADIEKVSEMMGHNSVDTTRIYTHLDMSHLQAEYDKYFPTTAKTKNDEPSVSELQLPLFAF